MYTTIHLNKSFNMNDKQERVFAPYVHSISKDGHEVQFRYGLPGKPKKGEVTVSKTEKHFRISRPWKKGDIKVVVRKDDGFGELIAEETVPRDSEIGALVETSRQRSRAVLIKNRQKIEEAEAELNEGEKLVAVYLTPADYDEIYSKLRFDFECLMRYVG